MIADHAPFIQGFSLANDTTRSLYNILADDPSRSQRFANTMNMFTSGNGFGTSHVISGFDWQSLREDATIVDVGGSRGHISIAVAAAFPSLNFVVQDSETTIAGAEAEVPKEVAGRVSFMSHDFFLQQPIVADVYYYRWVFHNWSDKYCIKILQTLIPILRPGAYILINDMCMAEPGTIAMWRDKEQR